MSNCRQNNAAKPDHVARIRTTLYAAACVVSTLLSGCGGGEIWRPIAHDQLHPVRLDPQGAPGAFQGEKDVLTATPAPDSTSGRSVETLAVLKDFDAQDLVVSGTVQADAGATAGYLFRTRGQSGVVTSTYALVLSAQGVELWQLASLGWLPLNRYVASLPPGRAHELRADVKGDKIAVSLDGLLLFTGRDTSLIHSGGVGLYARNGVCTFENVRARSLDRDLRRPSADAKGNDRTEPTPTGKESEPPSPAQHHQETPPQ